MTETTVRAGGHAPGALSAAAQTTQAVEGFIDEFKGFRADLKTRLQQQEERLTMLDRKTLGAARPALSAAAEIEVPHRKAFDAYLRNGDDDGLRGLVLEGKGLNTQVAAEGGYLVDPQTSETVRSSLRSTSSLRAVASVVQVEATSFDVLVDHGDVGTGWASEASAVVRSETVGVQAFVYTAAARAADGVQGPWRFEVAQVSDRFGPGPFTGIDLDE